MNRTKIRNHDYIKNDIELIKKGYFILRKGNLTFYMSKDEPLFIKNNNGNVFETSYKYGRYKLYDVPNSNYVLFVGLSHFSKFIVDIKYIDTVREYNYNLNSHPLLKTNRHSHYIKSISVSGEGVNVDYCGYIESDDIYHSCVSWNEVNDFKNLDIRLSSKKNKHFTVEKLIDISKASRNKYRNYNRKAKNIGIAFSGGLESTYLLEKAIKEGHNVYLYHFTQNRDISEETLSLHDAIKYYSEKFPDSYIGIGLIANFQMNIEERKMVIGAGQSPVVLALGLLASNINELWVGYTKKDLIKDGKKDIGSNLTLEELPLIIQKLGGLAEYPVRFPLIEDNIGKKDIIRELSIETMQRTISCERIIHYHHQTPCGTCGSCMEMGGAVLSLVEESINNKDEEMINKIKKMIDKKIINNETHASLKESYFHQKIIPMLKEEERDNAINNTERTPEKYSTTSLQPKFRLNSFINRNKKEMI